MLDRKFIVDNADAVKENCVRRGVKADVDRLVELDASRREKQALVEDLNRRANEVSKSIGKAKDAELHPHGDRIALGNHGGDAERSESCGKHETLRTSEARMARDAPHPHPRNDSLLDGRYAEPRIVACDA